MTKKRLIAIILIPIISIAILVGSVAIYKWYDQRYSGEIEILCVDKNGDNIVNQKFITNVVGRAWDIGFLVETDEQGKLTLDVIGPGKLDICIPYGDTIPRVEKEITKADIIGGEVIIIQFTDYIVNS